MIGRPDKAAAKLAPVVPPPTSGIRPIPAERRRAFLDGTLYVAELSKISKIEKVEDMLDNPPKPVVIYDNLQKDEAHGWKFYVPVAQPRNNVLHDDAHGRIRRINLDGSGAEVVALGVRNYGRPVDVLQLKDGSLLVSDDWNGAVYRISYGSRRLRRSSATAAGSSPQETIARSEAIH